MNQSEDVQRVASKSMQYIEQHLDMVMSDKKEEKE
jgi:hypothetical protein